MLFSGWWRWERSADGKLERGKSIVRGAEGLDVLVLGIEQSSFCVEEIEGGRTAKTVAGRCDAIALLGLRKEVIADESRLSQRGGRVRVGGLHVEAHLGA